MRHARNPIRLWQPGRQRTGIRNRSGSEPYCVFESVGVDHLGSVTYFSSKYERMGLVLIRSTHYRNLMRAMHDLVISWSYRAFKLLSCFTHLGIARAAPRCASSWTYARNCHASPRQQDIQKKNSMHVLKVKNTAIEHTSATHPRCSQHAWVNIGDVYSMWKYRRFFGWFLADACRYSHLQRKHQRCYGKASVSVFYSFSSPSKTTASPNAAPCRV